MPSTGQLTPGTVSQGNDGLVDWVDLSNVIADDATFATCSVANDQGSEYLLITNFGVAVNDAVMGIEVTIDDNSTFSGTSEVAVYLTKDGTSLIASPKLYVSSGVKTVGHSTDRWGVLWTEAEVEASTFGVIITCFADIGGSLDASIDYVRVNVYYSDGSYFHSPMRMM